MRTGTGAGYATNDPGQPQTNTLCKRGRAVEQVLIGKFSAEEKSGLDMSKRPSRP